MHVFMCRTVASLYHGGRFITVIDTTEERERKKRGRQKEA